MNELRPEKKIDILSVGELLIDLISIDYAHDLTAVNNFEKFPGGSPANLAMNMARLGKKVKLVASVGKDDMGVSLLNYVQQHKIDCQNLDQVDQPTTIILVTRTQTVANFEAYRGADSYIDTYQISNQIFSEISIFHTTCFALSKNPAQRTIMEKAGLAYMAGCQLSIDINYSPKIAPNRSEAIAFVEQFCSWGSFIKVSEVDWERLYKSPVKNPKEVLNHFLSKGAKIVCLTLGDKGCYVADKDNSFFLPSRKVIVKDTTGAGDAFWSGFLSAWLDQHSILDCAKAGRKMAELKLAIVGQLPKKVDIKELYEDLEYSKPIVD